MESWVAFEPFRHDMPIKGFTDLSVSGTQEAQELLMPRDNARALGATHHGARAAAPQRNNRPATARLTKTSHKPGEGRQQRRADSMPTQTPPALPG
jgi:hypothetical protein